LCGKKSVALFKSKYHYNFMDNNISSDFDPKGTFRDSVATIKKDGSRNYIFPKKPSGKHYNWRSYFSWLYLAVFLTIPFIKVHDQPWIMLNVLERKFILFGMIFWPQDFFIFGFAMLTFVVFIILFTVAFGRIFCGWVCPQTIFMEMVFRKIEYFIDGDFTKQRQLKEMPWNAFKIRKRVTKFVAFFGLSYFIANYFLAYLISMDVVLDMYKHPGEHIGTIIPLLIFTSVFFFVYWWFREQACIVVCPYGRLQGVLLDKNSIVVAYDKVRGEPRGKAKSETEISTHGDCIDCKACVRVCPTGIDIRNGTQLECVNCTACIDACDDIMDSINKPKGLVRYASHNSITDKVGLKFNARLKGYTAVLSILIIVLSVLVFTRKDVDVTLMRVSGMSYQKYSDGRFSNLYNLKLANKTRRDVPIVLHLENVNGEIVPVGSSNWTVKKEDYAVMEFFIKLKPEDIHGWKTEFKVVVEDGERHKKIKTAKVKFIGPEKYN
jgi:cytochrome c oxidase accessory protein FixG